ncbi:MAG: hypothetical protein ACLQGP_24885, partial [Isosphaeraceae bacterium]
KPFFKPGEARAAQPEGKADAAGGRGAGTRPPKPETNPAPSPPGPSPYRIDLGPAEGLSEERGALTRRSSNGLAWLWPSIAGVALLLGLALAWKFGFDSGPKGVDGKPAEPVVASRPRAEDRGPAKTPSDDTPVSRDEPPPAIIAESRPDRGRLVLSPAVPKAAASAVVPEPTIASRSLDPAPKVHGGDGSIVARPAVAKSPRDIRQLEVRRGVTRIPNPDGWLPRQGIWPALAADNVAAWQFGDPAHIEINHQGVFLSAGPGGNLLLTKRENYKRCTFKVTLAATKGTEAYLALRAHRREGEWCAITARIADEGGKIRVHHPSLDFQPPEAGTKPLEFPLEKSFVFRFEINDANVAQVRINQETWKRAYTSPPASDYTGAVGLFVKSGTVVIYAMNVQE